MTLSYSRMKFSHFSVDLFDAKTTIDAHIAAFHYYGGRTQMIMYDQDKTMVIFRKSWRSNLIKEFEDFIKDTGLAFYLCKGMIYPRKVKLKRPLIMSNISFWMEEFITV